MSDLLLLIGIILAGVSWSQRIDMFPSTENDEQSFPGRKTLRRSLVNTVRDSCGTTHELYRHRKNTTDKLRRLRLRMKASGYHAYIVPSMDEHQSEFVAEYDKRREFITGFTGSAGTAVILESAAALWTDGRYFIQAEKELDCNWILMKRNEKGTPNIHDWIMQNLEAGKFVGADSKLIPYYEWLRLQNEFRKANITLAEDGSNLIDDIWDIPQGRPLESVAHITVHDVKYAGKSIIEKLKDLQDFLREKEADGIILSALDEIAWLFNLRGQDVPYTPVFKAYAFISSTHNKLYVKMLKVTPEVQRHLCPQSNNESMCIQVEDYSRAFMNMKEIISETQKILISYTSSYAAVTLIPEENRLVDYEPSPVARLKVVKNPTEISGMKSASLKDSVAIIDFIAMLEKQVKAEKHWDEIKAAKALSKYRREQALNQGESFETISAFGTNAAIIHYSPKVLTNKYITTKHMYMLDTGGQYLDGTTDITRTFHFGEPTEQEVTAYTRVLMGAIDLITAVFPEGTKGINLDFLARKPLHSIGLDYQHGTGHGIGYFLSVHEGPIYIGKIRKNEGLPLTPGMFLSDEPGYYEEGKFGIRLETMMMVVNAQTRYQFNNQKYYTFEPVSFVPFEPKLIDLQLLTRKQKEWLNWFNMKTRNTVGIELKRQSRERGFQWLLSKTEYIPIDVHCSHSAILHSSYVTFTLPFVFIIFTFVSTFH